MWNFSKVCFWLILDCLYSDDIYQVKEIVEKKLSLKYEVHLLKLAYSQIRIIGILMTKTKNYLLKQNPDNFSSNFDVNLLREWDFVRDIGRLGLFSELFPSLFDNEAALAELKCGPSDHQLRDMSPHEWEVVNQPVFYSIDELGNFVFWDMMEWYGRVLVTNILEWI